MTEAELGVMHPKAQGCSDLWKLEGGKGGILPLELPEETSPAVTLTLVPETHFGLLTPKP